MRLEYQASLEWEIGRVRIGTMNHSGGIRMSFRKTCVALLLAVLCSLPNCLCAEQTAEGEALPEFNWIVLSLIKEYPTDGTHDYWWPRSGESNYDGCTRDLYYLGKKVMQGEPRKRTYCCGLTLEIFLRAYNEWLDRHGGRSAATLSAEDWPEFKKLWFVLELNGPGPSAALEAYQLGRTLRPEEVLPGDFVQMWRTKNSKGKMTGHSVIFLDWTRDNQGDITGIRYWSSQPGTNGISEREESYGPDGGISKEYTYFGRVEPKSSAEKDTGPAVGATTE